jgi:tRNA pseudouridine55 synthase
VRTLCADIGAKLGYGGCMAFLIRTRVGPFSLVACHTLEDLDRARSQGRLDDFLLPLDFPVAHLPRAIVAPKTVGSVIHGNQVPGTAVTWEQPQAPEAGQAVRLYTPKGTFLAIASVEKTSRLAIRKVFVQEEDGRCKS